MSGNLDPNRSPMTAPVTVRAAGSGVRRLNNVPLMIAFSVAVIVGGAIIYTFHERMAAQEQKAQAAVGNTPQPGNAANVLSSEPTAGLIQSPPTPPEPSTPGSPSSQQRQLNPIEQAQLQEWQDYEQHKTALEEARFSAEVAAIGATPNVPQSSSSGSAQPGAASAPLGAQQIAQAGSTPPPTLDTMQAGPSASPVSGGLGLGLGLGGGGGLLPANPNANDQTGKRNFLAQPGSSASGDYLQARVTSPVSPYEVKAGSVIPGTMIGGINSDLPGQVIAQVRENVYDTATGKYLLIPQGSRLVGVYSSGVTYGQTRVLVAWNRIIYPNGDSFDLGTMPGADDGGYAGFTDQVNNHYLRIFGSALLASVFSAGAQLSQPQNSNGTITSTQIMAASLGQQANTVGSMLIARGLDIQPTLEIRNGYLFDIMVTKDLILQPWQGMQPLAYGTPGRN
jgi:type IV secretion system protein TrbI